MINAPTPPPTGEAVAQWGTVQEKPMDQVTLTQFEGMLHEVYRLQDEMEEKQRQADEIKKIVEDRKSKLLSIFQKFEKTSYRFSRGLAVRQKRFAVQVPKEPEAKTAFFDFLKSRGIFDDLVTVNHQTLNAFYKAEMDKAVEKGDIDFEVPGIGKPKFMEILVLRRGR